MAEKSQKGRKIAIIGRLCIVIYWISYRNTQRVYNDICLTASTGVFCNPGTCTQKALCSSCPYSKNVVGREASCNYITIRFKTKRVAGRCKYYPEPLFLFNGCWGLNKSQVHNCFLVLRCFINCLESADFSVVFIV